MKPRPHTLSRLFLAALTVLLASCDGGTGEEPPPQGEFDRSEMLEHLGNALILPAYEALQGAVNDLDAAAAAFADGPTASNLDEVQGQLKNARLAWQDANLFQFGPAESVALRASLEHVTRSTKTRSRRTSRRAITPWAPSATALR